MTEVVIAGMQSNYCVAATSLGALREGFGVVLASGAHATYDQERSASTISSEVEVSLREAGALVIPVEDITFQGHPEIPREYRPAVETPWYD